MGDGPQPRRNWSVQAQHIRVSGLVQGVGFRPFVWRLAQELGLSGWVRNDARGVELLAQGPADQLAALVRRLRSDAPPLARVDAVQLEPVDAARAAELTPPQAALPWWIAVRVRIRPPSARMWPFVRTA